MAEKYFGSRQENMEDSEQESGIERERLERDLGHQKYTCAICMDTIKRHQLIWSCRECFVVLHLFCMKEWIFKYLDTVTMDSLPKQARDPSSGRGWLASP